MVCIVSFIAGKSYRKKFAEAEIGGAEEKAKAIIAEAIKVADTKKKEALLEAKDEIHKSRAEFEKESNETDKEFYTKCQRQRKLELEEANLEIIYKLDNLWRTKKINIFTFCM